MKSDFCSYECESVNVSSSVSSNAKTKDKKMETEPFLSDFHIVAHIVSCNANVLVLHFCSRQPSAAQSHLVLKRMQSYQSVTLFTCELKTRCFFSLSETLI